MSTTTLPYPQMYYHPTLPVLQLNTLDLGVNRIKCMDNLGHLAALTDLWINNNEIATFEEIEQLQVSA